MARVAWVRRPHQGVGGRSVARAAVFAAALQIFLSGCPKDPPLAAPAPKAVEPSSVKQGERQRVRILGECFYVAARRQIGSTVSINGAFSAQINGVPLEELERLGNGELAATLPETLPVGTWDLEVTGPSGTGVLAAALTVNPSENCLNGTDDDGDGSADCGDPDCLDRPCDDRNGCTLNDTCTGAGTCVGGPCVAPSSCHQASCTSGTCIITVRVGRTCSDGLSCTSSDICRDDGGCSGVSNCQTPPTPCHESTGTCGANGTCSYEVATGKACDDGVACTSSDACQASAGCAGVGYSCPPAGECFASACDGAGGCPLSVTYAAPCGDGGLCLGDGGCVSVVWPYQPSNFQPPQGYPGPDLTIAAGCFNTFSSATNSWGGSCPGTRPSATTVTMPGGTQASLISVWNLTIQPGAFLNLSGDKPVIFAVAGDARIYGRIGADSNGVSSGNTGPGANSTLCGLAAGGDATSASSGGGGGGLGSSGGNGGGTGAGAGGGASTPNREPLRGGCRGGAGNGTSFGLGGNGGGALQISAGGLLEVSSVITASGAGGKQATSSTAAGGGGGGSGGMLLLEGNTVTFTSTAILTSNGGGAGSGSGGGGAGKAGDDGATTSAVPAAGGVSTAAVGSGGNGAAGTTPAVAGQAGTTGGSGGGGGGTGVIIIRANGVCTRDPAAIVSPPVIGCP